MSDLVQGIGCVVPPEFEHGKNLVLGNCVIIEPGVVLGDDIRIGNFTIICKGSRIGRGAIIGDFCKLQSGTIFGEDVQFDDYCNTTGPCELGDRVRISKRSLVSRNVKIHPDVYFGGQVITSHSVQIQSRDSMDDLPTEIHSGCIIGMRTTIAAGVTICANVTTGYNTLVIKSLTEPGTYVGQPARLIRPRT